MKGRLSTHVLDITKGRPAAGVTVELWQLNIPSARRLKNVETNGEGRAALLDSTEMTVGTYELVFHIGAYFGSENSFLNEVPIRFRIVSVEEGYHVPLLISPWAYSTYRGS
jgi:hydroxyisourate hydrolase